MIVLLLIKIIIKTLFLKEYLPEKLLNSIYLAETCKYTTEYFWKNRNK